MRTDDTVISGKSRFIYFFGVDRSNQGAIGFAIVAAVAETTLTEIGTKFREDQVAVGIEVLERGVRCRVLAGVERQRNFARGCPGFGDQRIDQR